MTHMNPMPETAGELDEPKKSERECPSCKKRGQVTYQTWESNCGSYEDEKFTCGGCGYIWWVDGIDS